VGEDPAIRETTASYLGRVHDPWATVALVERAADKTEGRRVRFFAFLALQERRDGQAVDPLLALALDETEEDTMRSLAADVLGAIGNPRVLDPLVRLLPTVGGAANALARLGPVAVPPLLDALVHSNARVRQRVAYALGKLRDPRALDPLLAALSDPDATVRGYAAHALGRFSDDRVEATLAALLMRKDENALVRADAASGLRECGESALRPLADGLSDSDASVRARILQSIRLIVLRHRAAKRVQLNGWVVEAVLALLHDEDRQVRWQAIKTLGTLKDPRAVEPLLTLLGDVDVDARIAVIDALGDIGDLRALPTVQWLEQNDNATQDRHGSRSVKDAASQAIHRIRRDNDLDL